ncbi:MAG: hypothetical protein ACE363_09140 [Alphaproteobacteria bacterium]
MSKCAFSGLVLAGLVLLAACGAEETEPDVSAVDRGPDAIAADLTEILKQAAAKRARFSTDPDAPAQVIERTARVVVDQVASQFGQPPYWNIILENWDCSHLSDADACLRGGGVPIRYWVDPRFVDPRSIALDGPVPGTGETGHRLGFACTDFGSFGCIDAADLRRHEDYVVCDDNACSEEEAALQARREGDALAMAKARQTQKSNVVACGTVETCRRAEALFRELVDRAALRPHLTSVEDYKRAAARFGEATRGALWAQRTPDAEGRQSDNPFVPNEWQSKRTMSVSVDGEGRLQAVIDNCPAEPSSCDAEGRWYSHLVILEPGGLNPPGVRVHDSVRVSRGDKIINEWTGRAVFANCHEKEICTEEALESVSATGFQGIIPCHKDACQAAVFELQAMASFAAGPRFEDALKVLAADAHPVSEITTWEDADRAAERISGQFGSKPWPLRSGDTRYQIFQREAEFGPANELQIRGVYCTGDEDCRPGDTQYADSLFFLSDMKPESIRLSKFALLGDDPGLRMRCVSGEDVPCAGIGLSDGSDFYFSQVIITCADLDACKATAADLRGLQAFLETAPPRQSKADGAVSPAGDAGAIKQTSTPAQKEPATEGPPSDQASMVGYWRMVSPAWPGWVTKFNADGTFISNNAGPVLTGTYQAKTGTLYQQFPDFNTNRTVSYRFLDKDTLEFTDPNGASVWARQSGWSQ